MLPETGSVSATDGPNGSQPAHPIALIALIALIARPSTDPLTTLRSTE